MSKTAFAEPDKPIFQSAGEVCLSCKAIWENQETPKPPKIMEAVYDEYGEIMRTDSGTEIVICPWCDGDTILNLPKED